MPATGSVLGSATTDRVKNKYRGLNRQGTKNVKETKTDGVSSPMPASACPIRRNHPRRLTRLDRMLYHRCLFALLGALGTWRF